MCDVAGQIPRNTDSEAWTDQFSMNMHFQLNLTSVDHIAAAKLRIYKLSQDNITSSGDEDEVDEKKIRISVYYYTKALKKHRRKLSSNLIRVIEFTREIFREFRKIAILRSKETADGLRRDAAHGPGHSSRAGRQARFEILATELAGFTRQQQQSRPGDSDRGSGRPAIETGRIYTATFLREPRFGSEGM